MAMPLNLVLVRHGESEGNIAVARSKKGDHSAYTQAFRERHSSQWRLSEKGLLQADSTGRWIRDNLGFPFDRFYTSEYLRAMETASYLELPDASWFPHFFLRERNWGALDSITVEERETRYKESMLERAIDPFYWTPINGESLAECCLRTDRIIQTLHRECEGKNVIIVCHGEVMWSFRVLLERMTHEKFHRLDSSKDPKHRIHNCQILHYTRLNPTKKGGTISPHLDWMRSVCPWDMAFSSNRWQRITRPRFTNGELLNRVMRVKPLVT